MPTYEYVCDACGHAFELLQRMSDAPVRKCPSCAKRKVRRIISGGAGVIFKGSGFYETDYKRNRGGSHGRKGAPEPSAPEAPSKTESAPKPDTKAEAKPDPKPAAKSGGKPGAKDRA